MAVREIYPGFILLVTTESVREITSIHVDYFKFPNTQFLVTLCGDPYRSAVGEDRGEGGGGQIGGIESKKSDFGKKCQEKNGRG